MKHSRRGKDSRSEMLRGGGSRRNVDLATSDQLEYHDALGKKLPAPIRAWILGRRALRFRGQARVGVSLVRWLVDPDAVYQSAGGFRMQIDPEDYFQGCMLLDIYDPVGVSLARRYARPGSVVIDAGAHFGYFTLKLADTVGPQGSVHSFECDPRLVQRLRRHVEWNDFSWVQVNEVAVSDGRSGTLTLRLPEQLGWASLKDDHWIEAPKKVTVGATSLDDYLRKLDIQPAEVSFLKLDVEGAELEALEGLTQTLASTSAAVLVEFLPARLRAIGQDPSDILDFMHNHGYRAWQPKQSGLRDRVVELRDRDASSSGDLLFLKTARIDANHAPQELAF
jgi:FkbM family methyltransferase